MDQSISYGVNTYSFKKLRAMNYYFEIHSDWARGNKEMLMVSVILDSSDPSKYKTSEITDKISGLLVEFTEKFKSDDSIFTAFYFKDLKNFEYNDKKKIIEKNALLKTWVHDFYNSIMESTK